MLKIKYRCFPTNPLIHRSTIFHIYSHTKQTPHNRGHGSPLLISLTLCSHEPSSGSITVVLPWYWSACVPSFHRPPVYDNVVTQYTITAGGQGHKLQLGVSDIFTS